VELEWEQSPVAVSISRNVDSHFACGGEVWDADGRNLPSELPMSLQPQDR